MGLEHYATPAARTAAALVNTRPTARREDRLTAPEQLPSALRDDGWQIERPTPADLDAVRALRDRLGAAFDAPEAHQAVAVLNRLLTDAGALPQLTDHDGDWHFHYADPDQPLARRLAASCAMSLLLVIRDLGFDRIGVCAADDCDNVLVDLSRNHSRRFCDPRTCGNRASVAAYRARLRTKQEQEEGVRA
jgi:predicted RNA-binding Zn ribbon-like protein